jgi:hypothetical protein
MGGSARVAVSGHRGLPADTVRLISEALRVALEDSALAVTGLSCLADGADQIFARAVLDSGGQIEAVVPALRYREGLPAEALAEYDALIARAAVVHPLPFRDSTSEAHMAASEFMVGLADELWAVWDGEPARAYGGTADVVAYAHEKGIPVRVIWPEGAQRDWASLAGGRLLVGAS